MEPQSKSWTDDLPACHHTGAGFTTNQLYRPDGSRHEWHKFNDRRFHCRVDDQTSIYAVFAGQEGAGVAEAALERVAAEILLGQLTERSSEEEVRDVLRQAFVSAEKGYMESIDTILAKKASLQCQLEGISQYEISQQHQAIVDQLNDINQELTVGTSVALALFHLSKLYICNVGSCRVLLCKNDSYNVLRVVQLSVDHTVGNEDETLRLCQIGLEVSAFRQTPFVNTRCIGAYAGKGGYKDCAFLSGAISEPIAAQPEIVGAIPLDESCRFLILMSGGLCATLDDIYSGDTNQANKELVQMVVEEFRVQSTLMGVSQATVNKVVQLHHDLYMRHVEEQTIDATTTIKREDISLLVRNINFPMPNAIQKKGTAAAVHQTQLAPSSTTVSSSHQSSPVSNYFYADSTNGSNQFINTTGSSVDGVAFREERDRNFDKNRRIRAYVDFSGFVANVNRAKAAGKLPANWQHDVDQTTNNC